MAENTTGRKQPTQSRRRFLQHRSLLIGAGVACAVSIDPVSAQQGAPAGDEPSNIPEWMKTPGAQCRQSALRRAIAFRKECYRNIPKGLKQYPSSASRSPTSGPRWHHHAERPVLRTPSRRRAGDGPGEHRLMIHGLVERPLIFTVDDIRRFPAQSRIHFLECSGNPATRNCGGKNKTASDLVGLLSCARVDRRHCQDCPGRGRIKDDAKWVIAEGADAAALTRSIPIEKCLDDAMLVYSQNGERLRPEQGYPLRLSCRALKAT